MKKAITNLWVILPVLLSSMLVTLLALQILTSPYPDFLKHIFSLSLFSLYALVIIVFFLFILETERKKGEDIANKQWEEKWGALAGEKDSEIEALRQKLTAMPVISPTLAGMDGVALLQKCSFLEQYRNSFPYPVSEGYRLYAVLKTGVEVSKFSRWIIVGEYSDQLFCAEIVRPDNQSYKEMLQLAGATKSPEEIQNLSVHSEIWWE